MHHLQCHLFMYFLTLIHYCTIQSFVFYVLFFSPLHTLAVFICFSFLKADHLQSQNVFFHSSAKHKQVEPPPPILHSCLGEMDEFCSPCHIQRRLLEQGHTVIGGWTWQCHWGPDATTSKKQIFPDEVGRID